MRGFLFWADEFVEQADVFARSARRGRTLKTTRRRLPQRRQPRDRTRRAGQLEDVHSGVGAVDDVDIAAVVGLDVVGLDRDLALLLVADADAALVGRFRDRRNEVRDFLRLIGIAHV